MLARIPKERIQDVALFDPSDEAFPVGFNVLAAHSEVEKNLLASDLTEIFRRFSTSWGDQMTAVLGNAVLAFLEHPDGGTLVELRRFLADRTYRERYLAGVPDPEVVSFFKTTYPLLRGRPEVPILTRLDAFLRPRLIRSIVGQRDARLDGNLV